MLIALSSGLTVFIAAGTAGAVVVNGEPPEGAPAAEEPTEPFFAEAEAAAPDLAQARQDRAEVGEEALREAEAESLEEAEAEEGPDPADDEDLEPAGDGGTCEASNYWEPQPTASGEQFDPSAMTAAHKSLPFDTMVEVTNVDNGQSVTVRINDRGPYIDGRCLDLARGAFEKIASSSQGVASVDWQVVE